MTIISKRDVLFVFGFLLIIGSATPASARLVSARLVSAIPVPTGVMLEQVSASSIRLSWDAVSGATGYNIDRDRGSFTASVNAPSTSFLDINLTCGDIHAYRVSSYNGAGEISGFSDIVFGGPCPASAGADPAVGELPSGVTGTYTLLFQDEFDGSTLDDTKWETDYTWGASLFINNEKQYYVNWLDNPAFGFNPFEMTGGTLKITAIETPPHLAGAATGVDNNTGATVSQAYLSGVLRSDMGDFQYGYFETRAKLPAGQGFWPAFWLYYTDTGDIPVREIDIMEYVGDEINAVRHNYHYSDETDDSPGFSHWEDMFNPVNSVYIEGDDYAAEFHTFGVEWTPEKIVWYVDGQEAVRYEDADKISHQPMYILLNLAVGGWMPGDPDSSTEFPSSYEIDYVRVYTQDDSPPPSGDNLVENGDFGNGMTDWWFNNLDEQLVNGELCNSVSSSGNPWDLLFGQSNILIESGKSYVIRFDARATNSAQIYVRVGGMAPPYPQFIYEPVTLTSTMEEYTVSFTANATDNSQLEFHLGGNTADICIDNISLAEANVPTAVNLATVQTIDFSSTFSIVLLLLGMTLLTSGIRGRIRLWDK